MKRVPAGKPGGGQFAADPAKKTPRKIAPTTPLNKPYGNCPFDGTCAQDPAEHCLECGNPPTTNDSRHPALRNNPNPSNNWDPTRWLTAD